MEVNTGKGGNELQQDNLLTFPNGIPGFAGLTRFRLFHEQNEEEPSIYWLQSEEDDNIQLPVANPELFRVNYQVTLSDAEIELLQLRDADDIVVLVILYRDQKTDDEAGDAGPIRGNFLGPLIINAQQRLGMQKLLNEVEGFVNIQAS